jgi:flagellar protein FlbD
MIELTRLNNQLLILNSDLIKWVERSPDTVLTLISGEKIIVRETTEQVLERIVAFRKAILAGSLAKKLDAYPFLAVDPNVKDPGTP